MQRALHLVILGILLAYQISYTYSGARDGVSRAVYKIRVQKRRRADPKKGNEEKRGRKGKKGASAGGAKRLGLGGGVAPPLPVIYSCPRAARNLPPQF